MVNGRVKYKIKDVFDLSAGGDVDRNHFSTYKTSEHRYPIFSNSLENHGLYGYTSNPRYCANSVTITGRGSVGHAEYRQEAFDAIIRLLVLEPKDNRVYPRFVADFINNCIGFSVESTGVPQLTAPQIMNIELELPQYGEQKEIADLLADVNSLIEMLEKQLTKKKAIKQGAIQELLTGKKRLPGFSGEWKQYHLSEICQLINGRAYSQDELLPSGKYRVLRLGNLFTNGYWYYSDLELPEKQYCAKGDLIYAWSATFGPHIWEGEKVVYHYHIWKVELNALACKEYVYHYLRADVQMLMNELQGGTMAHLTKEAMEKRTIIMPEHDEQVAIAEILTNMDLEIAALEQKLAKYRQVKQGMMQQLLTGKIRLTEDR